MKGDLDLKCGFEDPGPLPACQPGTTGSEHSSFQPCRPPGCLLLLRMTIQRKRRKRKMTSIS